MSGNKGKLLVIIAAIVALALWVAAMLPSNNVLKVTFLDVGEGLCVVMITPSGKTLVMDCGTSSWRNSDTIGERLVAPYLQKHGIDVIDVAVLSHPHEDHVSGYAGLLKLKPAKLVLDIGAKHPSSLYKDFLAQVEKSDARYRVAKRGQVLDMGDGVRVEVLNPDPSKVYSDLNNQSAVLRVSYGNVSFILCADAEKEAETDMITSDADLKSQVMQIGHHGSHSSTSDEWLNAVQPEIAIIPCGYRNRYGHPANDVLESLESIGARVYRTDRHGAVECITDGKTISIQNYKRSK